MHAYGSWQNNKVEQLLKQEVPDKFVNYKTESRFWFESFQNWQSEFLAVAAIVLLSINLRQKGSSESKSIDATHFQTGD